MWCQRTNYHNEVDQSFSQKKRNFIYFNKHKSKPMIHVLMSTKQSKDWSSSTWETTPKDHGSQRPSFFKKKFFTERWLEIMSTQGGGGVTVPEGVQGMAGHGI